MPNNSRNRRDVPKKPSQSQRTNFRIVIIYALRYKNELIGNYFPKVSFKIASISLLEGAGAWL